MQGIICVHKPPSEGRKFIFGLFGHHRWGLFFSGNLEVIYDFANTASRWMLGLANRVPGSSRGILFYTSSIFVIVVWDAEPIRVTETHQLKIKIVVDSWYLLGCLLSFPQRSMILSLHGQKKGLQTYSFKRIFWFCTSHNNSKDQGCVK